MEQPPEVILDTIGISVVVSDPNRPDNPLIYVNPAFEDTTGYSFEEAVGKNPRFLQGSDGEQPALESLREALEEGEYWSGILRNYRKSGELSHNEISISPVRDVEGHLTHFIGVQRDVSKRVEAEEAAARYGRELSTIFESITDAFFALDTQWRFIYMNSEAERVLFRTREELLGQNVWEEFPAAMELSFYPQYHRAMGEGVTVEFEAYYPPLETWVEVKAYPSELGISVYFREINERKKAETEREESERRLRSVLLQYGSDIITIIDSNANITYESPAIEYTLGYGAEGRIGNNALELIHPDDAERVYGELAKLIKEGGTSSPVEYRIRHADGSWRYFESVGNNLLGEVGIEGIVVNSRDVTERKQLEHRVAWLASFPEQNPSPVIEVDLSGDLTYANAAVDKIFLELHTSMREHPLIEGFEDLVAQLEEGSEESVQDEVRAGDLFYQRVASQVPQEGLIRLYAVDITERKQAEEELRRRSAAIENSVEGLAILDAAGIYDYANMAHAKIYGYESPEELLGKSWRELYTEEELERFSRETVPSLMDNGHWRGEAQGKRRDGSTFPQELSLTVTEDGGLVCMVRDITDRKVAERELHRSEEHHRAFLEASPDLMFRVSREGVFLDFHANDNEELYTQPDQIIGDSVYSLLPSGIASDVLYHIDRTLQTCELQLYEYELPITAETRVFEARFVVSGIDEVLCIIRDITERKRAEEELRRSQEPLQTVIDNAPVVLFALDSEGVFTLCEGKALESLNLANNEMVGTSFFDLSSENPKIAQDGEKALSGETFTSMLEFGGLIFEVHFSPLKDEDGKLTEVMGLANDVTERERLQSQLEHQALHDTLTDLPNRALFNDHITKALERAERSGECVAVMFLDLDNFKHVNDSLGHSMGDELLVSVARRISSCLRPSDTVARIGGDEFTILLDGVGGEEEASHIAERIISQFRSPITLNGGEMEREVFTTASAGVVLTEPATEGRHSSEELLKRADTTLYRAKDGGRDNYLIFQQEMKERSVQRFNLEKELRRGIEREELLLHYQPVVSLDSGSTCGFEALVRWEHPERGLVSPAEFIPLAEETGLIVDIGRWVLREACHQATLWRQHLPSERPFSISVNLSPRQLRHPGIVEDVAGVLAETGLAPESLQLELTESVFIEDERTGFARVRELKELGVRLALDDFGTGYSSLSYLKNLPIDTLKIARSFIRNIEKDPEDKAFVSAILNLADSLGIKVVGEGVETSGQLHVLREPGPELAQGYYFAKPMPSHQAWEYLMGP